MRLEKTDLEGQTGILQNSFVSDQLIQNIEKVLMWQHIELYYDQDFSFQKILYMEILQSIREWSSITSGC